MTLSIFGFVLLFFLYITNNQWWDIQGQQLRCYSFIRAVASEDPSHGNNKVPFSPFYFPIPDMDEKDQIITTNMWINYKWHDYNFEWNPVNMPNGHPHSVDF